MTTQVRSVSVYMDAEVGAYVAKMRLAGRETDKAFASSTSNLRATNRELRLNETRLDAVTARTKAHATAVARLDTRTGKLSSSVADLNGNLRETDGHLDKAGARMIDLGSNVRGASRDLDAGGNAIDRYSGRLGILLQAAAVFGPTLSPLGAATVPVLGALTAGLGAAAGAIGVTLLAAGGLGDAFDALNEAQLEPTTENVAAMRAEFERVGPAGEQFIRYIDSLTPVLSDLQMTARSGLFPGVEDGIDSLLERTPQVRTMIRSLSSELGDLARDGGDALASDRFDGFFDYLETEAGPILSDFGRIAGNIFETIANTIVALDPVTQDFTGGLLDKTRDLAQWSRELGSNDSFQSFLDYIQESGPKALDFISTLVTSLADIAVAVAPVGDVVLPILTSVVGILGDIAASDIGTPLFAGVAALAAYNRAMATTVALQARMSTAGTLGGAATMLGVRGMADDADKGARSLGSLASAAGRAALPIAGIGIAASGAADGIGLSNTASLGLLGTLGGPLGAALGAAAGFTLDLASANDDLQASIDAAAGANAGDPLADLLAKRQELVDQFVETTTKGGFSGAVGRISAFLSRDEEETNAAIESIDRLIAARRRLDALPDQDPLDGLNDLFGELNGTVLESTSLMYDFADAAAAAMGFLDRRAAMRNYEEALDAVNAALEENGKTLDRTTPKGRANQEVLDQIGRSALIAAENLKGNNRATFLDDLRGNLRAAAEDLGANDRQVRRLLNSLGLIDQKKVRPEIEVETGEFDSRTERALAQLRKLDLDQADPEVNLLIGKFLAGNDNALRKLRALSRERAEPTVDLNDNSFAAVFDPTMRDLRRLDGEQASPTADLLTGAFDDGFFSTKARIQSLDGDTATVTIITNEILNKITNFRSNVIGNLNPFGSADGSTVPDDGGGYRDFLLYKLAPGEEVISNRRRQADRNRPLLKGINADLPPDRLMKLVGRAADGATAGANTLAASVSASRGNGIGPNSQLFGIGQAFLSIRELAARIDNLNREQLSDMSRDIDNLNKKGLEKLSAALGKANTQADRFGPVLEALNAAANGKAAVRRTLEDQLAIAQSMQEIRQLRRSLAADGKDKLEGLKRKIAELQLRAAEKELNLVENREERETRQAAREQAREANQAARETSRAVRGLLEGFDLGNIVPDERPVTVADQVGGELAKLKSDILDAGGEWNRSMNRWAKGLVAAASELDDVNAQLEAETKTRDDLVKTLADQQQALDELNSTMASYAESVANRFLNDPFNGSYTRTIPGVTNTGPSPELADAEAQLAAIRASATGDSVESAAAASRLIAQIAELRAREQTTEATEETVTGLEALREQLLADTDAAERMADALAALEAKGLDTTGTLGGLYQQLAASGDFATAEELAALSQAQVDEYEKLFATRENAAALVAAQATQAIYGAQQAELVAQVAASTAALSTVEATIAVLNEKVAVLGEQVRDGATEGSEAGARLLKPDLIDIKNAIRAIPRQTGEQKKKAKV
jgi:hypothetical protein